MNCRAALELLQQNLDGTAIESPEWLEHVRHCDDCRALASASRRLQDGLGLLSFPPPPFDLAERIVERVLLDRRRIRRRLRRRWMVGAALAASLFVVISLRLDWRTAAVFQVTGSNQPAETSAGEMTLTLRESAAELGEVFTALQNQTAEEAVGQARRWVSNVSSPVLPKVNLALMAPPSHPLRQAGAGLSESLQPMTNSARRAVELFLRELPMEEMID